MALSALKIIIGGINSFPITSMLTQGSGYTLTTTKTLGGGYIVLNSLSVFPQNEQERGITCNRYWMDYDFPVASGK